MNIARISPHLDRTVVRLVTGHGWTADSGQQPPVAVAGKEGGLVRVCDLGHRSVDVRLPVLDRFWEVLVEDRVLARLALLLLQRFPCLGGEVGTCGSGVLGRRSEEHTSELQSHSDLVCRLLLEKKKKNNYKHILLKKKKTKNK